MIFKFRDRQLDLSNRVAIMGILNVTPDSFSDGGDAHSVDHAVERALQIIDDGADILDIGGESTRPGAEPVAAAEEINRTIPVIQEIRTHSDTPISIDSYKADVAKAALEAGADIINDISGFHADAEMMSVARMFKAGCIVMHMRGSSRTMQEFTDYDDIIADIISYFDQAIREMAKNDIPAERVCLDPGIGFSKTAAQNLTLINQLQTFSSLERPVLVGPSRKSFIGKILGVDSPKERIWGTAAAVSCAVLRCASIVRVHDVTEMRQVVEVTQAILSETLDMR